MSYSGIRILTILPGVGPGWPLFFAIIYVGGVVRRKGLSLLGPFGPLVGAAFLFFPPPVGGGEASSSSSSSPWEECALGSSGDESDTTSRWELLRVPVAFFLAFFSGTTWAARTNNFVKHASAGPSGKGAGQSICLAFFCQSC